VSIDDSNIELARERGLLPGRKKKELSSLVNEALCYFLNRGGEIKNGME